MNFIDKRCVYLVDDYDERLIYVAIYDTVAEAKKAVKDYNNWKKNNEEEYEEMNLDERAAILLDHNKNVHFIDVSWGGDFSVEPENYVVF